jgi:hypothetical protein
MFLSLIGALLQCIRSSKSLRSFCIRTDRQPDREVEKRLVDEMVQAFFENRVGTKQLTCGCYISAALFCKCLISTTLKFMVLDIQFSVYSSDEEQRAIEDAFRSSTTLESLNVTSYHDNLMTYILTRLKIADC